MRGSTPCDSEENRRYGGNTSCVVIDEPGEIPIVLDLGTGVRFYGLSDSITEPFVGLALVSHLHWDHVQGLPFFTAINRPGARLEVVGPRQEGLSLEDAVRGFMRPPYFPVELDALVGTITFTEMWDSTIERGGFRIRSALVPHVGPTVGFRIEHGTTSIAYVSDHQQPGCGATRVDPGVLELCEGVDLLIHDAQFSDSEFASKHDWGHCTVDYAVHVAATAGAKTLALFHHDPLHDDDLIDELTLMAATTGATRGVGSVIAAYEGLSLSLG